jgi:hypothetical protein
MGGANHLTQFFISSMRESGVNPFSIREYRPDDFDALTIIWRISREKSLPDFQREKGHFFYEDQITNHILQNNYSMGCRIEQRPVAFGDHDFIDQLYIHPDYQSAELAGLY